MVVAFIQEVALLQPLKILMRWTVINGVVSADIRKTVFDFRDRSRIILMRSSGIMRIPMHLFSTSTRHVVQPECSQSSLFLVSCSL